MASLPQALPSSLVASVLCEHPSYRQRCQSSGLHHTQETPAEASCAENTYARRTNNCRRGIELPCPCAKVVMWCGVKLKQESPVCENRVWLTQFIVHQVHDCWQISLVAILQTRLKLDIILLHNRQCVYRDLPVGIGLSHRSCEHLQGKRVRQQSSMAVRRQTCRCGLLTQIATTRCRTEHLRLKVTSPKCDRCHRIYSASKRYSRERAAFALHYQQSAQRKKPTGSQPARRAAVNNRALRRLIFRSAFRTHFTQA